MDKIYDFTIVGSFLVKGTHKEHLAYDGRVIGFELPDNRIIRLMVGLETENQNTGKFKDITSGSDMDKLGFSCFDYGSCFEKNEERTENMEYQDMPAKKLPLSLGRVMFESSRVILRRRLKEGK